MEYHNLYGPQYLAAALPPPQPILGMVIQGIVTLSSRDCRAIISSGAPRTLIRPAFARGVGFLSIPQHGDYVQRPDGSWYRAIEHYHPGLRLRVDGVHWRVRAVEAETGPYDLILGADWLHEHRALVDVFGLSLSLQAPGGRVILQFSGQPSILGIVGVLPQPPAAHVAHAPPPEPVIDVEEEPEEDSGAAMEEGGDEAALPEDLQPEASGMIVGDDDEAITDED